MVPSLVVLISLGLAGGGYAAWELSRVGIHQGYSPRQPIAFSHRLHSQENQIPCLYCHSGAERSRHAGIPPMNVCMNCHSILSKATTDIQRLKESVQQGKPIEWIRIHKLPDFVYFSHQRHVLGGVQCQDCHGAVESAQQVSQHASLTMGWCLDCHRERQVVPQWQRSPLQGQGTQAVASGGLDCGNCHH